jgi:Flp pilus assembly protein TadG
VTGSDRGTVSMFTVLLTPTVFILAGLLFDGGLAIHARQRAYDIAEQAARVAANDIDEQKLRATGTVQINGADACDQALKFLNGAYAGQINPPQPGDCNLDPGLQKFSMTVHLTVESKFLGILPGLATFNMQGTASAHPDQGN